MSLELILGGARSGKSHFAEQRARQSEQNGLEVIYIATATAGDNEMADRIQHHQQQRPSHWYTAETPIHLAKTLQAHAHPQKCLIIDCLTLWLTNCLLAEGHCWEQEQQLLLENIHMLPGQKILVGNEVGHGIVPMGELSRRFVDENGRLHQSLAQLADNVFWVVAGLPQVLKGSL
ncbi:bifunctional adenosylcobinamide kinase/adenosylcobinamide-phosphate guanylyltransferase [Candidatus Albibeggiatoa sp. nov. NOAA]|uniref:bifunctional adenosylcobinamide kinase/adenosylcobinamide-phosphate guanylyltransferase n=1 Tax=Candidatus Albibeggiatoa sp. nov. NOAA TaxID=3162724 RepID=UPI0033042CD8|nr:bifunctional adenosylcobinamide kinase/adenosylcobinamide-phosphate guanylyltransferase [Thiotrichaceae bacterium]